METGAERRKNIRVSFKTQVCLRVLEGNVSDICSDQTRDISLRGLYVYTAERLPLGTACEVALRLSGASSELILYILGDIVRTDEHGMGILFKEMDVDSFLHLKNLLCYNSGNVEEIEAEIAGMPESPRVLDHEARKS